MTAADTVRVGNATVRGIGIDAEARCEHYDGECDVVAIKFPCCSAYYPCYRCHEAAADHPAERWSRTDFDEPAVLCGVCGAELRIDRYVSIDHRCPDCAAPFNPGCESHYDRYFEGWG